MRQILEESGVDTEIFSAHSTRGAGASAASAAGVPMDCILETAGWASQSVFKSFCHRSPDGDVLSTLLNGHSCIIVHICIKITLKTQVKEAQFLVCCPYRWPAAAGHSPVVNYYYYYPLLILFFKSSSYFTTK